MLSCTYETSYFPSPQRPRSLPFGDTVECTFSIDIAGVCPELPCGDRGKHRFRTRQSADPPHTQDNYPPHQCHHSRAL